MNIKSIIKNKIINYLRNNDSVEVVVLWFYSNELFVFKNINNFFEIEIGSLSREVEINEMVDVIEAIEDNKETILGSDNYDQIGDYVVRYLASLGVKDIGYEDEENMYDEDCRYIGTGPNGTIELLELLCEIIGEIKEEKNINDRPFIIIDYEGTYYLKNATERINGNGEAKEYLFLYS